MTECANRRLKALIWVAYHLEAPEIIDRYVKMVSEELESKRHEVVVCRDEKTAVREVEDADIMICWRILPSIFEKAKRLKWIQFGSAGIDHTLFPELLASDVILTTLSGIHQTPVSEHVLALMLAFSRKIDESVRLQMEKRYDRSHIAATASELRGCTLGILGIGKIGLELARICSCLGMKVIGTKRTRSEVPDYVDEIYAPEDLDSVLEQSDYLVLILPLTRSTKHLLGAREIGLMKPSAVLINVARGQMIDDDALMQALREGKLAGAALDVFSQEPLPSDSPLYDVPNLIMTPHVGGAHAGYADKAFEVFKSNLDAFERCSSMRNVFDRKRGY